MQRRTLKPAIDIAKLRAYHRRLPADVPRLPNSHPVYRDYFPDFVFNLRLLGASLPRIAEALGVTTETIHAWRRTKPEFSDCYDRGGIEADAEVARSYFIGATRGHRTTETKLFYDSKRGQVIRETYVQQHPPNAGSAANWLANRQSALWKSMRTATELTGTDGEPLSLPPVIVVRAVASVAEARAIEEQNRLERSRTIDADPRDDIWPTKP